MDDALKAKIQWDLVTLSVVAFSLSIPDSKLHWWVLLKRFDFKEKETFNIITKCLSTKNEVLSHSQVTPEQIEFLVSEVKTLMGFYFYFIRQSSQTWVAETTTLKPEFAAILRETTKELISKVDTNKEGEVYRDIEIQQLMKFILDNNISQSAIEIVYSRISRRSVPVGEDKNAE